MTELLIIKAGGEYYRVTDNGYEPCSFDKASVFPLDRVDMARDHCYRLRRSGMTANLMKLTLVEEILEE